MKLPPSLLQSCRKVIRRSVISNIPRHKCSLKQSVNTLGLPEILQQYLMLAWLWRAAEWIRIEYSILCLCFMSLNRDINFACFVDQAKNRAEKNQNELKLGEEIIKSWKMEWTGNRKVLSFPVLCHSARPCCTACCTDCRTRPDFPLLGRLEYIRRRYPPLLCEWRSGRKKCFWYIATAWKHSLGWSPLSVSGKVRPSWLSGLLKLSMTSLFSHH